MKKYILLFILFFSVIYQSVSAVWYNWTPTFSIPSIWSWSNILYTFTTGFFHSQYDNTAFHSQVSSDLKLISFANLIRIQSWVLLSWDILQWSIWTPSIWWTNGQPQCIQISQNCSWATTTLRAKPSDYVINWIDLYIDIYNSTLKNSTTLQRSFFQFTLEPSDLGRCPWLTSDCILVVQPRFYIKNTLIAWWTYIPYIDYTFYYDSNYESIFIRSYFWDLTESWYTPTFFESTLSFFWITTWWYWQLINWDIKTPTYTQSLIWYVFRRTNGSPSDDTILRDFFVWNTWSLLSAYFPSWLWSTQVNSQIIVNGFSTSTWSSSTGSTNSFYDQCRSWYEVGCYISWLWSQFWSTILDAFLWIMPDITFNWATNDCFGTWSTSGFGSGITEIWYFQKVANLFVLVIPLPPTEWSSICTYEWLQEMQYRRAYTWSITQKVKTTTPDTYNGFDTLLLLVFTLAWASYLYALTHNKPHD